LNILYYYSSQQVHTGSPQVLLRLIDCLDRERYRPFFLASQNGKLCQELKKKDVEILNCEQGIVSKRGLFRNIININKIAYLLRINKIDVVHINELGYNFELVVAAKMLRIPVILHNHNPAVFSRKNINCLFGDKFIFVSNSLVKECKGSEMIRNKTEVVYNPIDFDHFSSGKPIRAQLGIEQNQQVVGTIAQICPRKGIDIFIATAEKVAKSLPDARFLIVGPEAIGAEAYAAEMRELIQRKNLGDTVKFMGPRNDIPDILASLDLFFLPSRAEPFGLVLVEAIAAGVPVVASSVGGIPEIIPTREIGIVKSLEEGAFEEEIVGLLKNENQRRCHSRHAFRYAYEHFSKDRFIDGMNAMYQNLV